MTTSFNPMLSLSILILVATQVCSGEDQGSLYQREAELVAATREVSEALQYFNNTMQDVLRVQKHSIEALYTLPDMMQQVKEELQKHNMKENSFKQEIEALNKVISLTQENTDLKNHLVNKDEKVDILTQENVDLKNQLDNKTLHVNICSQDLMELKQLLDSKNLLVQDLNSKLGEYQLHVQELEQQVKELNNTVENRKAADWTWECEQKQHLEKIKQLVQQYLNTTHWPSLRKELYAVLDNSSVEYKQLQRAMSPWMVGSEGCTQLASLLLCAGLPVDNSDNFGGTMLDGAAKSGQLQLVKFLLEHHASVSVKGRYDETPLMSAAQGGNLEVVQCLVQAGADTTARDQFDHTALYYAGAKGHKEVVQYLEQLPH